MAPQHKALTWTGRVMTGLIGLMLLFSASMKLMNLPDFSKEWVDRLGYSADLALPIAMAEICCAVLYLIPQTTILGAVLLTGYLGGAIATHVRIHDNFIGPAIGGILVWLAVYIRDPRVRTVLPLRQSVTSGRSNP